MTKAGASAAARRARARFVVGAITTAALAAGCELVLGHIPAAVDSAEGGAATSAVSASRSSGSGGAAASSSADSSSAGTSSSGGASATTTAISTTATSVASSGSGACCDCDGDGHDAIGPCGGDDCDDTDAYAYPGESQYYPLANARVGFDWNCDGFATPNPALEKTLDCAMQHPPCSGEGYVAPTPPACGDSAPWGACVQQGIVCVASVVTQSQPMSCR
ncbi:MAG TPA: hypothetical protein VGM56_30000 [Byssovorax sp.]|jgi:hypothetical protein